MRKCNTKYHNKRQSGRRVLHYIWDSYGFNMVHRDLCPHTHATVNDKGMQLQCNPLLTGLLNQAGVFS